MGSESLFPDSAVRTQYVWWPHVSLNRLVPSPRQGAVSQSAVIEPFRTTTHSMSGSSSRRTVTAAG